MGWTGAFVYVVLTDASWILYRYPYRDVGELFGFNTTCRSSRMMVLQRFTAEQRICFSF